MNSLRANERAREPPLFQRGAGGISFGTTQPLAFLEGSLHQVSFWLPEPGWLRFYMWFHIGMGWFLTTLFGVGLTGLVRRVTTGEGSP